MPGLARQSETEIECPFCEKGKVKTYYREGYMQAHTSRISGKSATRSQQKGEIYRVLEDCPHCGAKKKDIQAKIDGTYRKPMTREERIEMLKKRGLPLVIKSG